MTNPDFNKILYEALERQKEEKYMNDYQARELIAVLKQISKSLKEISKALHEKENQEGEYDGKTV